MFNFIVYTFRQFCRGSVVLVSLLSSFPGFFLLFPAFVLCLIDQQTIGADQVCIFIASSLILSYSLAIYLWVVSFFVSTSMLLYLISESDYKMLVIDFLGREFTEKFLGNPRDHTVRVVLVPTLAFCMMSFVIHHTGSFSW